MSDKTDKIQKMLELQKKFMQFEHEHGVDSETYYAASAEHPLHNYRQQYQELANAVCNLAHGEKGSKRD
ncbi:MAG: hypothetical protein HY080_15820 [Gammaproteobacteria bacterium]|nr:hypothetical protein [Gammaproteobacteria bacterium]